jgi:hypothetical protein
MDPRSSGDRKPPDILADARFRRAFAELQTGIDYAETTTGDRWDFAVEIYVLRRFGLSDNDLRFLVQKKFVEHAHESTTYESDKRAFQSARRVMFDKRTCFVLTPLGIAKAHCPSYQAMPPDPVRVQANLPRTTCGVPAWDPSRRVLSYDGQTVKRFTRSAVNQERILSAFEEEGWPPRVLDPLAPHLAQDIKQRLADTIKSLNRGQANALIHFCGDGTGEGILWKPAVENRIVRIPPFRLR